MPNYISLHLLTRAVKVPWREALTIGTLMNTRGLVELIVLNLGLDAKVSESVERLLDLPSA